ncbi:MAG: histidinol-phosphate transaminase [Parvibaculales bacterium]
MTALKPKPGIMDLPAYVGGREVLDGIDNPVKLSANESPLGPSPLAVAAYKTAADNLEVYPDGAALALREVLAEKHGLDVDKIVCGFGSDELLQLLPQAYAGPGDEVIHTAHGFLVYKLAATAAGAKAISVPEPQLTADVDLMLAAVTQNTRIVFLANPNNPTGTMISKQEVRRLHAGLREDIVLVLDGAYAEYVDPDTYEDGFDLVDSAANVVTTRTFSKIHGLAALRLGWAYGAPEIIEVLNRLRGPFNVNTPAMLAGIASVQDDAHIAKAVAHNTQWRAWLAQRLDACGFETIPSEANFILVNFDPDGPVSVAEADAALCQAGLIARQVGGYGLPHSLRISIGTQPAMEQVAAVFETLRSE